MSQTLLSKKCHKSSKKLLFTTKLPKCKKNEYSTENNQHFCNF